MKTETMEPEDQVEDEELKIEEEAEDQVEDEELEIEETETETEDLVKVLIEQREHLAQLQKTLSEMKHEITKVFDKMQLY